MTIDRRGFIKTVFLASTDHEAGNGPMFNHAEANKIGQGVSAALGLQTIQDMAALPSYINSCRFDGSEWNWVPDSVLPVLTNAAAGVAQRRNGYVGDGRWERQYSGFASVSWFIPADAVEHSDFIQQAIDSCSGELDITGEFYLNQSITISARDQSEIRFNAKFNYIEILDIGVYFNTTGHGFHASGRLTINGSNKLKNGYLIDDASSLSVGALIVNNVTEWGVKFGDENNNSFKADYLRTINCGTSGTLSFTKSADTSTSSAVSQKSTLAVSVPADAHRVVIDNHAHLIIGNDGSAIDIWPVTGINSGNLEYLVGGGISHTTGADNNVAGVQKAVAAGCSLGLLFDGVFGNQYSSYTAEANVIGLMVGSTPTHQSPGNVITQGYFENNQIDVVEASEAANVKITEYIFEQSSGVHRISSMFQMALNGVTTSGQRANCFSSYFGKGQRVGNKTYNLRVISGVAGTIPTVLNSFVYNEGPLTSDYTITLSDTKSGYALVSSNVLVEFELLMHGFGARSVVITPPPGRTVEGAATFTIPPKDRLRISFQLVKNDYRLIY